MKFQDALEYALRSETAQNIRNFVKSGDTTCTTNDSTNIEIMANGSTPSPDINLIRSNQNVNNFPSTSGTQYQGPYRAATSQSRPQNFNQTNPSPRDNFSNYRRQTPQHSPTEFQNTHTNGYNRGYNCNERRQEQNLTNNTGNSDVSSSFAAA